MIEDWGGGGGHCHSLNHTKIDSDRVVFLDLFDLDLDHAANIVSLDKTSL